MFGFGEKKETEIKETMMNATQIANKLSNALDLELKAKDINKALIEIKYMGKRGDTLIPLNDLGEVNSGKKDNETYYYVLWSDSILIDENLQTQLKKNFGKVEEKKISTPAEKEKRLLTASQIAKEINSDAKTVNDALISLGYSTKDDSGYKLVKKFFGQEATYEGQTYIRWNEDILRNKKFLDAVKPSIKVSTEEYFDVDRAHWDKKYYEEVGALKASGDLEGLKKLQSKAPQLYRSNRGENVRSKGELLIANYLHSLAIPYSYEKRVEGLTENVLSDFYINFLYIKNGELINKKIYIELWGFENEPKYLARKKAKLALYKKSGHILVEFDDSKVSKDFDSLFNLTFDRHPQLDSGLIEMRNKHFDYLIKTS